MQYLMQQQKKKILSNKLLKNLTSELQFPTTLTVFNCIFTIFFIYISKCNISCNNKKRKSLVTNY